MPKFKVDQVVVLEVFDADFKDCDPMLCKVMEVTGNGVYRVCTVKAKIDESVMECELEPVEEWEFDAVALEEILNADPTIEVATLREAAAMEDVDVVSVPATDKTKLAVTKTKVALEQTTSSKKNATGANAKIATPRSESRAITTSDAKLATRSNPKESSGNGAPAHTSTTVSTTTNAKPVKAPTKSTESNAKKGKMALPPLPGPSTKDLTGNTQQKKSIKGPGKALLRYAKATKIEIPDSAWKGVEGDMKQKTEHRHTKKTNMNAVVTSEIPKELAKVQQTITNAKPPTATTPKPSTAITPKPPTTTTANTKRPVDGYSSDEYPSPCTSQTIHVAMPESAREEDVGPAPVEADEMVSKGNRSPDSRTNQASIQQNAPFSRTSLKRQAPASVDAKKSHSTPATAITKRRKVQHAAEKPPGGSRDVPSVPSVDSPVVLNTIIGTKAGRTKRDSSGKNVGRIIWNNPDPDNSMQMATSYAPTDARLAEEQDEELNDYYTEDIELWEELAMDDAILQSKIPAIEFALKNHFPSIARLDTYSESQDIVFYRMTKTRCLLSLADPKWYRLTTYYNNFRTRLEIQLTGKYTHPLRSRSSDDEEEREQKKLPAHPKSKTARRWKQQREMEASATFEKECDILKGKKYITRNACFGYYDHIKFDLLSLLSDPRVCGVFPRTFKMAFDTHEKKYGSSFTDWVAEVMVPLVIQTWICEDLQPYFRDKKELIATAARIISSRRVTMFNRMVTNAADTRRRLRKINAPLRWKMDGDDEWMEEMRLVADGSMEGFTGPGGYPKAMPYDAPERVTLCG
ncbi:hypothetical protein BJ508DRAFT_336198 [Ascobolus immersus RN42]|uniref:Uncharacterized protein n=1 Tax=Ascobolus immersus RN42 TaxID=1160509 RepID=A0A3N4HDG5_ASCIM|nr:hypothetical protein BJ508DRAFT_336198 [Ascobolus immersus RN42]